MACDVKNENYLIKNAWELYIKKGILKRHILRDEVAYSWVRSRLAGVEYNQRINNLVEAKNVKLNIRFTPKMQQWIKKEQLSVIISTADAVIIDSVITHNQLMGMEPNKKVIQSKTGNLSIYSTKTHLTTTYYCGAEHYLECLHFITDYSMMLHIKHNTYIITFFEKINTNSPVKRLQMFECIKNEWLEIWNNDNLLTNNVSNNALNAGDFALNTGDVYFENEKKAPQQNKSSVDNILILGKQHSDINDKIKSICKGLGRGFVVFTIDFWYVDFKMLNRIIQRQNSLDNVLIIFKNVEKLSINARKKFINALSNIKNNADKQMLTITIIDDTSEMIVNDNLNVFGDVIKLKHQKRKENNNLCDGVGALYDLTEIEKNVIINALEKTNQNMSKTAKLLNICRSTLYRKIDKYGIDLK